MGEHIEEVKQIGNQIITTHHYKGWVQTGAFSWTWRNKKWDTTYWVPYTFTPAKTKKELKIIGLKNAYLQPGTSPYGMTLKKFDTASYVDRAILQLKNETAGNVVVRDISIRGEPVYQIAGQNGFIWEYSDYDSIDKNGEQFKEIGNDFIFDAGQAESIGDFAWKVLKPHQVYTLALRGCQYQYQIGDIYTLNIDYSLDASSSQIELVNVDVEIIGVSFERSVGSVGSTMLACRVDLGAWSKTTSRRAQLVGTGQANNNTNRTNTVTVASSTYTGTADYYCDGNDDHVEIQRAIDDLYAIGGGMIQLTNGNYTLSDDMFVKTNVIISGHGANSNIYMTNGKYIYIDGTEIVFEYLSFSSITTSGIIYSYSPTASALVESCTFYDTTRCAIDNSSISNCIFNESSAILGDNVSIYGCRFYTDSLTPISVSGTNSSKIVNNRVKMKTGNTTAIAVGAVDSVVSNNIITGHTAASTTLRGIDISGDKNIISGNRVYNVSGSALTRGILIHGDRNNVSGNTSLNCTTNYQDSGTNTLATGNIFS